MKYVVTHGGRPHLDDFTACALSMCRKGPVSQDDSVLPTLETWTTVPIYRRYPTADELADPGVLVLDVGGRLEPGRSNFDHHQLPRDDVRCAMRLLAGHVRVPHKDEAGRYQTFAEFFPKVFPWWETAIVFDHLGPYAAAKMHGLTWDKVAKFRGPCDKVLLDMFADPQLSPWDRGVLVYRTYTRYIDNTVASWFDVQSKLRWGRVGNTPVLDLTGCDPIAAAQLAESGSCPGFDAMLNGVVVYVAAPRSDGENWENTGLAIRRVGDDKHGINFTKVKDDPLVTFCHENGFLAKMKGRDMDEARRLIHIATT